MNKNPLLRSHATSIHSNYKRFMCVARYLWTMFCVAVFVCVCVCAYEVDEGSGHFIHDALFYVLQQCTLDLMEKWQTHQRERQSGQHSHIHTCTRIHSRNQRKIFFGKINNWKFNTKWWNFWHTLAWKVETVNAWNVLATVFVAVDARVFAGYEYFCCELHRTAVGGGLKCVLQDNIGEVYIAVNRHG